MPVPPQPPAQPPSGYDNPGGAPVPTFKNLNLPPGEDMSLRYDAPARNVSASDYRNGDSGLPGYQEWSNANETAGYGAGTQSYYDPTHQQNTRDQQLSYLQQLQAQANGTAGPSAAQMQLQRGTQQGQSQQLGMAGNRRGISGTGALYGAQQNQAQIGQQGVASGRVLGLQEQQSAKSQLANMSGQLRQQDQANAQMQMQQAQQQDQMVQFFMSNGMSWDEAQKQAQQQLMQMQIQQTQGLDALRMEAHQQDLDRELRGYQQYVQVAGGVAGALV